MTRNPEFTILIVTSITLENFKCFEALEIPCAPLTVLTGYNAAGKSTTLQTLLLLAQALRVASHDRRLPLNGELVTLGAGGDVIRHDAAGKSLRLGAGNSRESIIWTFVHRPKFSARGLMALESVEYIRDGVVKRSTQRIRPAIGRSKSPLVSALRDTVFIGAGRAVESETCPVPRTPSRPPGDVGANGEYAAYWYLEYADEEVAVARRHPDDDRETVRAQVDAWLGELFPNARVNADRLTADSPIRLTFSSSRSSRWAQPANVGYGLSYAFPVLVALLTAAPGTIIVVDSAEAHLHPRAQSAVGRLLGRMAGAGLQIFVETHSDHLLNGIRLAVRDGLLNPEDAALHFFGPGGDVGRVTTVTIDRTGAISDWPEGFFDQAERDLATLAGWE